MSLGSQPQPSLGVVAISYNEQEDMPGFLDHLVGWVDEIVVVDDGSTDRTEEICTAQGPKVRFLRAPREDREYYSDQRNKGIAAAQSDWLLHMDIDERVTHSLAREIREAIRDPACDGYRFRRLNHFMHRPMRGGGWQDWNLIHLARRELFRFGGMFHESCHLDAPEDRVGQLKNRMVHFNEHNFEKRLTKSGVYLEELVRQIEKRGTVRGWQILWAPLKEFLKKYFYKLGFRDGTPGLISAMHSATAVFRAYALVWDRQNRVSRAELEQQVTWKEPLRHAPQNP
ncbi:glycosyltransferase family 2 protein [Pontibaca salina]|uniref:Glycosyltransferase family 2 protein n=1 Tax=Pontibaca salina TaxID=2795731 RepID=A0A934HLF0_9RHOB|nr:glycosyltransferase family 2 protein [Pontibaca salina]MBI6630258.1 glycosyltransferase family 2 protein [Pontibaca salina]